MKRLGTVILLLIVASVLFAGGNGEDEVILRIGSSNISMDEMAIFNDNIAEFEAANPGVKVQWDASSGDDYQFTPGTVFSAVFRFKNTGPTTWDSGYTLRWYQGSKLGHSKLKVTLDEAGNIKTVAPSKIKKPN